MAKNPSYLPDEILIQIFSKLPAKAVGRCRCLSKKWSTQLSTCQFSNLHLLNHRSKTNQQNLLISPVDCSLRIIDGPIADNTVSRKLEFGITWNRVGGSCNGLVLLLSDKERQLYLVNPNTLQHFKLPPLLFGGFICMYGLGYDSSSDDYKVVALDYCSVVGTHWFDRLVDVYSVKSGAWKRVHTSAHMFPFPVIYDGAFINGAVHWHYISDISDKDDSSCVVVIDAFDLTDDVFLEIPAAPITSFTNISLLVLQGCLCMSSFFYSGNIEIWMMKQYGLPDSWTKFTIPANMELRIRHPLCSIGDREIVLVTYHNTLVVYNLTNGTTKVMVVDGVPAACRKGVACVDSLVSPNHQYSN